VGALYVSTKVVWQPGHRGASTTVLEPAAGELLHAMQPAAGMRGVTMCGVDATRLQRSWRTVTLVEKCARCQEAVDRAAVDRAAVHEDVIDLRSGLPALELGD
jgi:hypothetical protein